MAAFDFGSFVETLRKLRGEEQALVALLEKADRDDSASELIAAEHRRDLARIRAQLVQQQGAASGVLDRLVSQINELRRKALEVRGNIEELRDHAKLGGADPKLSEFSLQLQRSYRDLFNRISRRELDLNGLQEELRQMDRDDRGGVVPPRAAALSILDAPTSISEPLHVPASRSRIPLPTKAPGLGFLLDPGRAPRETASTAPRRLPPSPAPAPAAGRLPKTAVKGTAAALPAASPSPVRDTARDRKVERRFPYQAPVRIRTDARALLARSGDISKSGMFLEGRPTLPAGTSVVLGLCFHDFPLEISGEVVYETPGVGMGVRFTAMSEIDARYLAELIGQLRKVQTAPRTTATGGTRLS